MLYKVAGIGICALLIFCFVEMYVRPAPEIPANPSVNETTFSAISEGMRRDEVATLLGEPHRIVGGAITKVESQEGRDFKIVLMDKRLQPGADELAIYDGRYEESIRILFSAGTGRVMAIEYRVSGEPILYEGSRSFAVTSPLFGSGTGRAIDPEMERRMEALRRYKRVKQLRGEGMVEAMPSPPIASQRVDPDAPPPPLPAAKKAE